ncbi:30S ribosomal protein S5 [Candidatus Woesearchaeota archaeon]|nr:30S ribosomal protein S5 [Candidatus Woesearchaeota archaeon]
MARPDTRKERKNKPEKATQEEPLKEADEEESIVLDKEAVVEEIVPEVPLEVEPGESVPEEKQKLSIESWKPKTTLGKRVKEREITDIDQILDHGQKILEAEISDALLPDLETELLLVGQSKGKFGGGQRRVFKQTQKKTQEGNKPHFATIAIVGDRNGHYGMGYGKSKETVPTREKAIRKAKLNVIKIRRGCGSWECDCKTPHSIPFKVHGKCGSCSIMLIPAPKGTGLCIEEECGKILSLAGIKDIWSKTEGTTTTKTNLMKACDNALRQLMRTKIPERYAQNYCVVEGKVPKQTDKLTETKEVAVTITEGE